MNNKDRKVVNIGGGKTVTLGDTVIDQVTGFKGRATGVVTYLTGCDQILVAPKVEASGKSIPSGWFDVNRISKCREDRLELDDLDDGTVGACEEAPVK